MLLKILLLQVMSIGLITVPIKAQEPPVILHPVPPMYFNYFDQDLWSTIWHLSEYLPFSNQDKQFLRDVIKAAQIPEFEFYSNDDEQLSQPDVEQDAESDEERPNQGPGVSTGDNEDGGSQVTTDNGGIQTEERPGNTHIIEQVGGVYVNKPTTIGNMPSNEPQESPPDVQRKGMRMGGNTFLNSPNRQIPNQMVAGYPGYVLVPPGTQWAGNTFANIPYGQPQGVLSTGNTFANIPYGQPQGFMSTGNTFSNIPYGQPQGFMSTGNTFVSSVNRQVPNQMIAGYPRYAWVQGVQPTGTTFINSPAIVPTTKKGEFMDIPFFNKTTHDFGGTQHIYRSKGTSIIQHAGGTYSNMPTVIGTPKDNGKYYNEQPKGDVDFSHFDEETNTKRTFVSRGNTYVDSPVAINYRKVPETLNWNSRRSDFDSSEDDEIEVSMELSKEDIDYDPIDVVRNSNANNDKTRVIQPENLPPDVEIFSNSEINVDPISKPEKYLVEIINRTTNKIITNPTRSQYIVPKKYYSEYKKTAYPKFSNKNRVICDKYLNNHPSSDSNEWDSYENWPNMHEAGSVCQCMKVKSQAIKALPHYMSRMMVKPSNMDKNNVLEEQKNSQRFVDKPKYLSDFTNKDITKKEYIKPTTQGDIKSYLYLKKKLELPHMQVEYNPAMAHIDGFVNH